ncbi:SPOR domain-containing protein [Leptothrix sp. BB-4]
MAFPQSGARKGALSSQRGGFALGLIVGLLIGVGLSLAVALYVTKVPVPFVDKVPQRTAEQDAAEARKNENWNPNAPLAGKSGGSAATPAPAPAAPAASSGAATPAPVAPPVAVIGASKPAPAAATPAASGTSARSGADPFQYFVQVGAYTRTEEAEQQRAKLAINGLIAKVSERPQGSGTMYRVRLGPFEVREDADRAKEQAAGAGYSDAAVVRVAR